VIGCAHPTGTFPSQPRLLRGRSLLGFLLACGLGVAALGLDPDKKITQYLLDHWDARDGLPQNSVYAIAQTPDGYLWLGTEEGLARFDGVRFTVYNSRNVPGLTANFIWSLLEDRRGNLWIGTNDGGLNRFDRATETFQAYRHNPDKPASPAENNIRCLFEDRSGALWLGTNSQGLDRFDPASGQFAHFPPAPADPSGLSDGQVLSIVQDTSGAIWAGTIDGLNRLDPKTGHFRRFRHDPGNPASLGSDEIHTLFLDNARRLWVGTSAGIHLFDPASGAFRRYRHDPADPGSLPHDTVLYIHEDRQHRLWLGTLKGIAIFDPATGNCRNLASQSDDPDSLSNNIVLTIAQDDTDIFWIGTAGGGLNKYSHFRTRFRHVRHEPGNPNSLSQNTVRAFFEDRSGQLWIGTVGGGLNRYDPESRQYQHYRNDPADPASFGGETVSAIFEDRAGNLWVGSWDDGLDRMDRARTRFTHFRHDPANPDSLSHNTVQCIFEDKAGRLWIGTEAGLNLFRPETGSFSHFRHIPGDPNSLSDDRVQSNAIVEDQDGRLWVGTWQGLNRLDPQTGRFTTYLNDPKTPHSLSDNRVISLCQARSGRLWIGTYGGGLDALDTRHGRFEHFTEKVGLPSGVVYGILEDQDGCLWLSTNNGLCRLDPRRRQCRNYKAGDGLQSNQFFWGAAYRGRDGSLYFGGINGYNVFDPKKIQENRHIPPIVLTSLKRLGQSVPYRGTLTAPQEIRLTYQDKHFGFEFAALDFVEPSKNQYAYKLEGFDPDWIYSGTRRYVNYTNIAGGDFVFRVKGSNSDGVWNEAGIAVPIRIRPAFWTTLWFRLLIAVGLVAGAAAWYKTRVRRIQKQKAALEQQVAERTQQLQQKNQELALRKEELEKINTIVKTINTEISFRDLLHSIMKETSVIKGVEMASMLVFDRMANTFKFMAAAGSNLDELKGVEFSLEEAEERYTRHAREIFPEIYLNRDLADRPFPGKLPRLGQPKSLMAMRIVVTQCVEGYLLLENYQNPEAFENQDILLFKNLKEHILSAFIKTRILEELQLLNEKKNEFMGLAAHDLRNPLNAIIGRLSLMLHHLRNQRVLSIEHKEDLEGVLKAAEQMQELIADLLDISAIESGNLRLQLRQESLLQLLRESTGLYGRIAAQKNITLTFQPDEALPPVLLDRTRITAVLDNLLSNAVKYTYPNGKIRVYTELTGRQVLVHIEDTGQGLDADDLKEIFLTYRKLSARPTGGEPSTGLGLAIVKKIVEAHGGQVGVRSQKGTGSTFTFSLPLGSGTAAPGPGAPEVP